MKFLLSFLSVFIFLSLVRADWDIREHLATKTPYWSKGSTAPSPAPPSCDLVHIDFVGRHGARNPTNGDVRDLSNLAVEVRNYNPHIKDSFAWIKNWTNPFYPNQQGFLSLSGQEELYLMGQRFKSTYYPMFSEKYFPDVYVIQSTQVPRTGVSAASFAQGFLQGSGRLGPNDFQPAFIFSDTPSYDYLRFFDNCYQYQEAMDNGTLNENEADKYLAENYPAIASQTAEMLGVSGIWNISIKTLASMLTACAFEVAVYNKTDGWCSVFSMPELSMYEYGCDLATYWTKSYGSGLGYQIGAVVLQNVVQTMEGIISNSQPTQKAYLRFAHAETILPLSAVLGLYKNDYPLLANLTQSQIDNRNWSTSFVAPFASNIAFLLYSCGNDYMVKLTVNEVDTPFPGCGEIYCPYTTFKSLYASALSFNFTSACAAPSRFPLPPAQRGSVTVEEFAVGIVVALCVGAALVFLGALLYIRKQKIRYMSLKLEMN